MTIGKVYLKIAGRDAGQLCVIVEQLENSFVLIDGNTRRRKCNLRHLEPLGKSVNISEGAATEEVLTAMKEAGLETAERKKSTKERTKKEKPVKQRTAKKEAAKINKVAKKTKEKKK